jgi:mannosyltransferase OCH1-like enzyme
MIPKTLHVVWIGDESKRPDNCIDTWRRHHLAWEVRVWGNEAFREESWLNRAHMQAMWQHELCGVADMMRYEILYRHGGVVLDADSACLRPLPDWLLEPDVFACWESELARPGLVATSAIGAVPGNPFIGQIILDIHKATTVIDKRAWETTGPMRITTTWRTHRYPLTVYPSHYFIPEHFTGQRYEGSGPVFATQSWASTVGAYDTLHHAPIARGEQWNSRAGVP